MARSSEQPAVSPAFDAHPHRLLLNVHLQPGAKSTALAGWHGDAVKIRVPAPAVENKANSTLIAFLRELLDIPAHQIRIVGGQHARRKRIEITGPGDVLQARLCALLLNAPG